MAQDVADQGGTIIKEKRRRWHRRPASRRFDLTPEQQAELAEKEKASRRTALLGVKLTPEEKEAVTRRADAYKYSLSDFARMVLLSPEKTPAPPTIDPEAVNALAFQLSRLGGHLNQMAKVANQIHALPRVAEFNALAAEIKAALGRVLPP